MAEHEMETRKLDATLERLTASLLVLFCVLC